MTILAAIIYSLIWARDNISSVSEPWMIKHLLPILLLITIGNLKAQDSTFLKILNKVLYNERVYSKVFYEYKGVGEKYAVLPQGTYTFILPDSNFQRYYPEILDKLSVSWGIERKLFTVTLISNSKGTVFIKNEIFMDQNLKLFIVFDKISIKAQFAELSFHTTALDITDDQKKNASKTNFVKILVKLKINKGEWIIKRLKVNDYLCCDNIFPNLKD